VREKGTEWVDTTAVSYCLNVSNVVVPPPVVPEHDPVVSGGQRLASAGGPRADPGAAPTSGRIPAIDVVKGLAIIGVIAQHALTREDMDGTGADFWFRQSVPVLFVLMGFNAARSSLRRPGPTLAEAYGARYWRGRFQRILLPLLIVSAVAIVAGAATGHLHLRALALVGYLPVPGPGVYWITILLTFTLIWPAWMHLFRLRPGLVVVAAIALDVGFELWAGRVPDFRGAGSGGGYPYAYDASILRYVAAIAIGMWLAIDDGRAARRRLVVMALAVPSVAYIALAGTDPASLPSFVHGFTLATNFAAVPWAAAMLLAVLHLWPARSVPGTGWLERVGVASYEVFLVQVVWLGVLQDRGLVHFLVAAVASGLLGCALHRVVTATTVGSLGLRRGTLARS
jgi:peptidoglycan/LPS O-acetylase OafA/YrhL